MVFERLRVLDAWPDDNVGSSISRKRPAKVPNLSARATAKREEELSLIEMLAVRIWGATSDQQFIASKNGYMGLGLNEVREETRYIFFLVGTCR